MIYGIVVTLSLFLMAICVGLIYKNLNFFKMLVLSSGAYIILFVVISGLLFWFNRFSFFAVMILCIAAELFLVAVLYRKGLRFSYDNDMKPAAAPLIIIACLLPVCWQLYGFYGLGQDEGVYQTKAIELMYGNYSNYHYFTEQANLETEEDKTAYREMKELLDIGGYYQTDTGEENDKENLPGVYHGIPTYPALLALSGLIFGIASMGRINTIMYFLAVVFIYMTAKNLKFSKWMCILATLVAALSPVVIWVSKSTLTEQFLMLAYAMFLYFLTDSENPNYRFFAAVPVVGFAFLHASIYAFIPLFAAIFIWLFCVTREKQFIWGALISTGGFAVGFTMMLSVSQVYIMNNSVKLYSVLPFLNNDNLMFFAPGVFLLTAVFCFAAVKLDTNWILRLTVSKIFSYILKAAVLILIAYLAYYAVKIGFLTDKTNRFYGKGLISVSYTSIYGFTVLTGCVFLTAAVLTMLFKTKAFTRNLSVLTLGIMFIYCVLIYSAVFQKTFNDYYYYSRYIVPAIPIVTLAGGAALDKLFEKHQKAAVAIAGAVSLVFILPFDWYLISAQDDTKIQFEVLEDAADSISENSALILDKETSPESVRLFALTMKAMANADIYMLNDDFEQQYENLFEIYEHVYLMTDASFAKEVTSHTTVVYRETTQWSSDSESRYSSLIVFPRGFAKGERTVTLYECDLSYYAGVYSIGSQSVESSGFDIWIGDYAWIYGDTAKVTLDIAEVKDYTITVSQVQQMLLDKLEYDSYIVRFYINEIEAAVIDLAETDETFSFSADEKLFVEGENELKIVCDSTWSPSEYGENDKRKFGMAVSEIRLSD